MQLGLSDGFKARGEVFRLIKRCCGLPLLDVEMIYSVFDRIKNYIPPPEDNDHIRCQSFIEYMTLTWVGSDDRLPK